MVHVFCTWMLCVSNIYDTHISIMKYFQLLQNIASYLYVHHTCFKCITFVCKKHKLMNFSFVAQFPLSNHEMKSLWCMPSQAINVLILHTFISHWVGASLWKTILFKTHCFFATWFRMLIKFFFWVYIFLGD